VQLVAGVDLGGTAINYTLVNREEQFLIEGCASIRHFRSKDQKSVFSRS